MIQHQIRTALPERSGYGLCFIICHDEDMSERDMNLEMGCLIDVKQHAPVMLYDGLQLTSKQLPAVPMMATTIVTGALEVIHAGYGQMALWIQNNGYQMAGNPREITLKNPESINGYDLVTELQFPVELVS